MKTYYQVFQDGKPADIIGYPEFKGECWSNSSFLTLREAQLYAILWAYPFGIEVAEKVLEQMEFLPGTPIDMSMCEFPVMMEIREIRK